MKVLMLSADAKILDTDSPTQRRMLEYGALFDELHIVVFAKRKAQNEKRKIQISENVFVYPITPKIKLLYFWQAYWLSKKTLNTKYQILDTRWVVTSQEAFTNVVALLLKWRFGISFQMQIHTDFLSPYFKKESLKNWLRYWSYVWGVKNADCIRVVSGRIADDLKAKSYKLKAEPVILPIFVDTQKIKNAEPISPRPFEFTVLWVGRLEKEKNCSLAIDAFAQFARNVLGVGLVIVGNGSEYEDLSFKISDLGLKERVLLVGWKDNVFGYYKSVDVLLATSWYEGNGMQMVEARIAGLPVIAPDIGVAKEVGAYIAEHSPTSMANLLTQLHARELPMPQEYRYPYKNKEQYLQLYKQSFEQCLVKHKKI